MRGSRFTALGLGMSQNRGSLAPVLYLPHGGGPLHVCYGVAIAETATAEVVFNEEIMGKRVTGLLWR